VSHAPVTIAPSDIRPAFPLLIDCVCLR